MISWFQPIALLRKIEAALDFAFIHDLTITASTAPDNGCPPLDPTLMFKALFVGYLFGVRSERQLVREIEVNVANRRFLRAQADRSGVRRLDAEPEPEAALSGRLGPAGDLRHASSSRRWRIGLIEGTTLYTTRPISKRAPTRTSSTLRQSTKSRAAYREALDAR